MKKIGILTFHYSNNCGGILQCYSLFKVLKDKGYDVEVINYIPSSYKPENFYSSLFPGRNPIRWITQFQKPSELIKKIKIKKEYNSIVTNNCNEFRKENINLSDKVNENEIKHIVNDYDVIIVGSDQVWNPSQRKRKEYFLDFDNKYRGKKFSYAADSTVAEVKPERKYNLLTKLGSFDSISVRNNHSYKFIENTLGINHELVKNSMIVADPTILCDFKNLEIKEYDEEYILVYALGQEINGGNKEVIKMIKEKYGDLPIYSVCIPTMDFKLNDYADRIYYDVDPIKWLELFYNAKFVFTDSFHGTLFSLKFQKPFLSYYVEALRATRFFDLGERYKISNHIVNSVSEIIEKESLEKKYDFSKTEDLITDHKNLSLDYLDSILSVD